MGKLKMQQRSLGFLPLFALAFALTMMLGAHAQAGSDDASAAVQLLNAKWDKAFNSGDAAAVAALYAEDGRVVTGDGKIMNGRDEIQALFQSFMDGGFHDHKIEMIDVKANGDTAYETGKWSGVGGDKKTYGGHLVNIYQRQSSGDWQAVLHIWN
jgi:uncharacterized protein (TIGR02246 family)